MPYHEVVTEIKNVLEEQNVWFEYFEHQPVVTSKEASAVRPEYSLAQGTKALIVRVTDRFNDTYFVMLVVAGNQKYSAKKVRSMLHAKDIRLARKDEVSTITRGVPIGGIPPFGNLFNLPVYVDTNVFNNETIIFSAGDRRVSIALRSQDFKMLVKPIIADMA